MRRITLILLLLMQSLCVLYAQSDIFRWGITGGANITRASSDGPGILNTGWRFDTSGGYYVGLSARLSIPVLNLGLEGSFVYSQETAKMQTSGIIAQDQLRYFSIPVHLRYDLELPLLSSTIIPFGFLGPQCNLSLNEFDWYDALSQYPDWKELISENPQNETPGRIWKFDLGFGVILLKHIQIAYSYAIPLSDTFSFETAIEQGNNNFRLGTHRIGVTYFF